MFLLSEKKITLSFSLNFSVLLAAILFIFNTANAQYRDKDRLRQFSSDKLEQTQQQELAKRIQQRADQQLVLQALEKEIDPVSYVVGPGDRFQLNIWGPSSGEFSAPLIVTPEGKLIIPTVGTIDVKNQSLVEVQHAAKQACEAKYDLRSTNISINLTQLRSIRVHVYGEVNTPGSFVGTPVDRISSFIQQAEDWTEWAVERRVEVRHTDGTADTLDMYKLYNDGDLQQDPFARGGDVIYFPRLELTGKKAFVEGEVPLPGPHQIAKNESAIEFLYRVQAIQRQADLNEIYLQRGNQPPGRLDLFGNGTNGDKHLNANDLQVEDGDRFLITDKKDRVYVHGAVQNPGSYPYLVGYKAIDYVGFAGGTQNMAGLSKIKIIHRDSEKTEKGGEKDVSGGDTIIVPVSTRSNISQYLSIVSQVATLLIAASAVGILK